MTPSRMLSSLRMHWMSASPGWRGHFQDSLCTYFVVLHVELLFVRFAKFLTCLKVQLNFSFLHIIMGPKLMSTYYRTTLYFHHNLQSATFSLSHEICGPTVVLWKRAHCIYHINIFAMVSYRCIIDPMQIWLPFYDSFVRI